jgi:Fic family protein
VRYPWDESDPTVKQLIDRNLAKLLPDVFASGRRRDPVSLRLVREWHRRTLKGVPLNERNVAGVFRGGGSAKYRLRRYNVIIGGSLGVDARHVAAQVKQFEEALRDKVNDLDSRIDAGTPAKDLEGEVLDLCAWAHGEWARIHPFADGNGRTARAWLLWCAARYGLPPFLVLRPRPGLRHPSGRPTPYEMAAEASMSGRHQPMQIVLRDMLADYRRQNSPP